MNEQEKKEKNTSLQDRFVRWQQLRINHLSFTNNLFLGFNLGFIGFLISKNSISFDCKCWISFIGDLSLLMLGCSFITGIATVLNRLKDFRHTERLVKFRKCKFENDYEIKKHADIEQIEFNIKSEKLLTDKLGKLTWSLLYWQILTFGIGITLSVFFFILNECQLNNNFLNGKTAAVFNPSITYGTISDQDGNIYKTVTIRAQTWMAENLRTTKYNDGTNIPLVPNNTVWSELRTGAYCNYNNTVSNSTIATYGRLYNWYAVSTGKLAPKGWHVATDSEWKTLTDYLGGESIAGIKLKETGTSHWPNSNIGSTNEIGFTALPGGFRDSDGTFDDVGYSGTWWSATQSDTDNAWYRNMDYDISNVDRYNDNKEIGFSVRCVRD